MDDLLPLYVLQLKAYQAGHLHFLTAPAALCHVAMSPTSTTTGLPARLALCRLHSPLPKPGPRCSSAMAGALAMRA